MIHSVNKKKKEIRIDKKPDQKVILNSVIVNDKKHTAMITLEYEIVQ